MFRGSLRGLQRSVWGAHRVPRVPWGAHRVLRGFLWGIRVVYRGLGAKGVPMGCGKVFGGPKRCLGKRLWGGWGGRGAPVGCFDIGVTWGAQGAYKMPGGFTESAWGARKVLRWSLSGFWGSYGDLGYVWDAKGYT